MTKKFLNNYDAESIEVHPSAFTRCVLVNMIVIVRLRSRVVSWYLNWQTKTPENIQAKNVHKLRKMDIKYEIRVFPFVSSILHFPIV